MRAIQSRMRSMHRCVNQVGQSTVVIRCGITWRYVTSKLSSRAYTSLTSAWGGTAPLFLDNATDTNIAKPTVKRRKTYCEQAYTCGQENVAATRLLGCPVVCCFTRQSARHPYAAATSTSEEPIYITRVSYDHKQYLCLWKSKLNSVMLCMQQDL